MNWTTIERALHAWAVSSSGLPADRVIWSLQSGGRPAPPYLVLRIMSLVPTGQDWVGVTTVSNPVAGQEIEHKQRGGRRGVLSLQVFASPATGVMAAVSLLEQVIGKSRLPTVRDILATAKIGLGSFEPITSLDELIGSTLECRAVVEVPIFTVAETTEFGTNVETVEVTNQIPDPDVVFQVS